MVVGDKAGLIMHMTSLMTGRMYDDINGCLLIARNRRYWCFAGFCEVSD